MARDKVIVVGAGLGGLACAIDLARGGLEVTVVERAAAPGGKLREITVGGVRIDSGPTVFTLRWVFDDLFADAGAALEDHLVLRPADLLARHAWDGGETLDLYADIARTEDAIGRFAGAREAAGYRAFHAESARIHDTLRDTFLTRQQGGMIGLIRRGGVRGLARLMGIRPFETLWSALGDHFHDPRLRQLFGRYATYCGASPFEAPATLMLIACVEQEGVWLVEGGMRRLADALEVLAVSVGVRFRLGAEVARIDIEGGRAGGVTLADGERLAAGAVVVNADSQAVATGLLGQDAARATPARPPASRSLSAVTWSLQARAADFPLTRHNVFFSGDYRAEFEDILTAGRLPWAPTAYVCAQDRGEGGGAPSGPERLFLIVNAPANGDQRDFDERELYACETAVFDHLARCGLRVARTAELTARTTPRMFNALFPGTGGALYGPAMHGWASAFRRPGAKTRIPGLYLAGGGAHPGAGVPMAALSGRLAAQRLLADRASTRPWRRGAMSGGMSTP